MKRAFARHTYKLRSIWPPMNFHGLKVQMRGDHISLAIWKRVFRGDYEAPEIKALLALLRPEDRLLELGAGMGLVSGLAAKRFPKLIVHSYEANPAMIPVINDLNHMKGLTNVVLHNTILMPVAEEGTRSFHVATSFAESSVMAPTTPDRASAKNSVDVPQRDIRQVFASLRPDVMLCDIEGGEAKLFSGLDLSHLRALVLELHPERIGREAEARIYDTAAKGGLYPRIELCSGTVVAFESIHRDKVGLHQAD